MVQQGMQEVPKSVYLRDRMSGETTRIGASGVPASMSGDARLIAFEVYPENPDCEPGEHWDVCLFDRETQTAQRLGLSRFSLHLAWRIDPKISKDGRYIVGTAFSQPPAEGSETRRLFLYDRDEDSLEDVTPEAPYPGFATRPSISGGGRYAASLWFAVAPSPRLVYEEIYLYDRVTDFTTLLTRLPDGSPSRGRHGGPVIQRGRKCRGLFVQNRRDGRGGGRRQLGPLSVPGSLGAMAVTSSATTAGRRCG